jgi:hypothetical protein
MADENETPQDILEAGDFPAVDSKQRRRWRRIALGSGIAVVLAVGYAWLTREQIAGNVIQSRLDEYGIAGTYHIESIGPRRQVLTDIVIGDPRRPDLTIERVEVSLAPTFGLPRIDTVRLVRPRLYGAWRDGKVSFGVLDHYLYERKTEEPTRLPDIDLVLEDGRARIETPLGRVGAAARGMGNLASGFKGSVAVVAPGIAAEDCRGANAVLAGKLTTSLGRPYFRGPLSIERLDCAGISLTRSTLALDVRSDRELAVVEARSVLKAGRGSAMDAGWSSITGKLDANWREGLLTGRYDLAANEVSSPYLRIGKLQSSGSLRARGGAASFEWQGDLDGRGAAMGGPLASSLAKWRHSSQGTLAAPILARIADVMRRETPGSRLAADFTLRRRDGQFALVVPSAHLRGTSGATLLSVSRVQLGLGDKPQLSGNFTSGGGLPPITGRMEQAAGASATINVSMAPYRAGSASIALPELVLAQQGDGTLRFGGRIEADGEIPGGFVKGMDLPLSGTWSDRSGLALWRNCAPIAVERLTLASMELAGPMLQLCPAAKGRAIVETGSGQTRIAARLPGLDLVGRLGASPLRIRGGAVAIAPGGQVTLKDLDVTLGPPASATRLALSRLDMKVGGETTGSFAGAAFGLYSVPLDIREGTGNWRYAGGRLEIRGASITVEDRKTDDRFQPLVARDAGLTLADNVITADALLRNPASDRPVTRLALRHVLETGAGDARLAVEQLRFDDKLQPDMLSRLLLGVIANAAGAVTGEGRIDWNERGVTSSGDFGTDALDFAAAFGPAQGVSGKVHFTDLVGLTTAPNQVLTVRSINPGIEVFDGRIGYELTNGEVLTLHDARWPFLGGTLVMDPVAMRIGVAETRKYVLHLDGVDAGQFVQRMELGNISATGLFDGTIPLVFDENGGRVEHGVLRSREPGGNLSYVGELTYKDLSPMANIAFDALRSLDYRKMRVELDGPLTGEIVTRVIFDGIRQGTSAKRNIVTRQIAKLPIRFNVNIHAPFYRLITSLKSMYDPAMVRDPRELGLLDRFGNPVEKPQLSPKAVLPAKITGNESTVQRPESEDAP